MSKPPRPDDDRDRAGGKVVIALILVLALLVGGGYAAAYLVAGDGLPRGTTVAGVEVGGLDADAASAKLEDALSGRLEEDIEVSVEGGESTTVTPDQAGLAVDYAASVDQAAREQSWRPDSLWDAYTGGDDLDAVISVDDAKMTALIEELTQGLGTEPTDATVRFVDGRVTTTDARDGRGLDPDATSAALADAFLAADDADRQVELAPTTLEPDITDDDARVAVEEFANPALSGSVTLVFGKSPVTLRPSQYADALSLEPVDGSLEPRVDSKVLDRLVRSATGRAGKPVDATFTVVKGKPRVVPAKPGVTFESGSIADTFLETVVMPEGERELEVPATVDEPEFSTADARALGIRRQVSTFTTYFPYAEYRNINIGRAAELVNGTLLKPDEVFSLNDIVGERTRENGFTEGFIISNGIFKEDLGGGVSQMATTTFNAMFFAGLEDIEHKPHSFYIDRYPVGREATVAWGSVDLRFRNNTDHGVFITASLTPSSPSSQGSVTVRMFSTKIWDIESITSDRYAYVSPGTRTLYTPDCYPNTGFSGFQVDVTRVFRKKGEDAVDRRETFHTDYIASDTVICRPPGSEPGAGGGGGQDADGDQ